MPSTAASASSPVVAIKVKLIGMDRAINPDFLEAVQRTNADAEAIGAQYEKAGPFQCLEHPEGRPVIEITAIFQSRVKVRQVGFCCEALADQVKERMAKMLA